MSNGHIQRESPQSVETAKVPRKPAAKKGTAKGQTPRK